MFPPSARTKRSMEFLCRHLQNFECLSPPERSFVLDPFPFQGQSLTTPLSLLASDSNQTITPPPSASLSSYSANGRRDRENAPLLAAGIPAPLGIYGNFVLDNEYDIIRQQSTQTTGRRNFPRSRSTSW